MNVTQPHTRIERFRFVSFDSKEQSVSVSTAATLEDATLPTFTEVLATKEIEILPPAPTFSEEEMEQARQQAFARGVLAGKQEAEAARNKAAEEQASAMQTLLQIIPNRITIASEEQQRFLKNQHKLMLNLCLAIARKVAGDALKRDPNTSVEALIKECVALFADNERIIIYVNAQRYVGIKQSIDTIRPYLKDFQGEVVIEADDALAENDCRIEWKSGAAQHNSEQLWAEIEKIVKKTVW